MIIMTLSDQIFENIMIFSDKKILDINHSVPNIIINQILPISQAIKVKKQ